MKLTFHLNGIEKMVETDPDRRVVDLIREDFGLTGTKEACGAGDCGACTILVDGESRLSCLMLAVQLQGRWITTIEGLAEGESLNPIQRAFLEAGAVQCGFCIPGMILASANLLTRNPSPSRDDIRRALAGNLCRCTGYRKIVDAVEQASRMINDEDGL